MKQPTEPSMTVPSGTGAAAPEPPGPSGTGAAAPEPPGPPASVFDPATSAVYLEVLRTIDARGHAGPAAARLVEAFDSALRRDEAAARSDGSAASAENVAIHKRVVFEVLHHLARATDLGDARERTAALLGRTSLFAPLAHPRFLVTQDWFSHNIPIWKTLLAPWAGKAGIRALEIGSFEGMSACWLLENVLTHATSRIVCVDPFDAPGQPQAERHFVENVRRTEAGHKVTRLKGLSRQALPLLAGSRFDIVYVDGSHHPADALEDALLVWPLLERGGIAIFDDYGIGASYPPEIAAAVDPRPGIDAFLTLVQRESEVVWRAYQLAVKRT